MHLNVSILLEQLSDIILCSKNDNYSDELHLNRPEHYINQEVLLCDHIYLSSQQSLPASLKTELGACLICVGKPPEVFFNKELSIICVKEEINILALFNEVQVLFDQYDTWDQRLQQCVNYNTDLQDIIDVSDIIFRNPIYFSDADYRILAESKNNPLNIKYNYIPEKCLTDLKQSENYEQMWNNGIPTFSDHDYRHLSIVVRSQSRFVLFISIMEARAPFRESDPILLRHMAHYALLNYEQNQVHKQNHYTSLDYILKQYLNKQQVTEQILEKALTSHSWKANHNFYFCFIELSEMDIRYNMIKSQCAQIEKIFTTSAIVFEYHNNLCAVINLSLLSDTKTETKLHSLLQSSNLRLGKSKEFSDITNVRNYYIQASSALELGKHLNPNLHCYKFDDYCLEYILNSPCQNLTPESLCPDGLIKMREYDKNHNTQYVLTLKTYIDQKFNATHAAKKMFIHRTTLLERLNKISTFINMDLDDPRNCLYLMIALVLLDH